MRTITRVETFDGAVHTGAAAARKHLDKLYGTELTRVAGHLAQIDKYQAACEYIDGNLGVFVYMHQIKQDMFMEAPDEDEDL